MEHIKQIPTGNGIKIWRSICDASFAIEGIVPMDKIQEFQHDHSHIEVHKHEEPAPVQIENFEGKLDHRKDCNQVYLWQDDVKIDFWTLFYHTKLSGKRVRITITELPE